MADVMSILGSSEGLVKDCPMLGKSVQMSVRRRGGGLVNAHAIEIRACCTPVGL